MLHSICQQIWKTQQWPQDWKISVFIPIPKKVKVKSLSRVQLFVTQWTVAHRAPPPMGFSRQEYWSGLPFPSPEDLLDPGIKPGSPCSQTLYCLSLTYSLKTCFPPLEQLLCLACFTSWFCVIGLTSSNLNLGPRPVLPVVTGLHWKQCLAL